MAPPRAFKDGRAFAVMHGGRFLSFASYRVAWPSDSPLKANLYARRTEAVKRAEKGVWVGGEHTTDLQVVEIEVDWRIVS